MAHFHIPTLKGGPQFSSEYQQNGFPVRRTRGGVHLGCFEFYGAQTFSLLIRSSHIGRGGRNQRRVWRGGEAVVHSGGARLSSCEVVASFLLLSGGVGFSPTGTTGRECAEPTILEDSSWSSSSGNIPPRRISGRDFDETNCPTSKPYGVSAPSGNMRTRARDPSLTDSVYSYHNLPQRVISKEAIKRSGLRA